MTAIGPAPATPCCDLHNRNCEPPSELCCDQCSEWDHPGHASGTECIAPDLSGNGPARNLIQLAEEQDKALEETRAALAAAEARIAAALISASIVISPLEEWDAANIADFMREIRRALSVEAAGTEGGGGHE